MQTPLIADGISDMPVSMKIDSRISTERNVSVMVKLTEDMNNKLKAIAEEIGGGAGVATVLRIIAENALAEGITVRKPAAAPAEKRAKSNGEARAT
jgi:Ni2+-binding GTPase involved in maturation of urease and hydrogenase